MDKIKNLPVFRMLAFAVALALILGICSVFLRVTASADTVTNGIALDLSVHQIGALGKYPVIGLPSSGLIADYIATADSNSTNSIVDYFVPFTVYNGVVYYSDILASISYRHSYFDNLPTCTINLGGQIVLTTIYDSIKAGSDTPTKSTDYRYLEISSVRNVVTAHYTTYPNDFYKCTYAFKSSKGDILSDTNVSSIMYARVLTSPYNATVDTNSSSYIKDTDSFHETPVKPTGGSENGRFICFGNYKEYTYDEHLADISSGSVYQRNDYLASEQTKYTAFMFDDTSCFNWADARVTSGHIVMYPSTSIAFNYYNASDSVGAVKLRVSKTQMFPSLRQSDNPFDVSHYFVMKPANKHFSRYVIISDGSLRSVPAKSTATFRLNMQGYCNMDWNSYYLCEIVDVQSDTVISSAMFVYTGKNSGKIDGSNIKNGSFISVDYEYEDGNNVDDGSLTPDDDGTLPNLPNGIKDDTYNPSGNYNLSNLDISDIFSSLNQATASVGAFFQATLNIIPITIMTLILGSLALLIVLRILGR